MPKQLVRILITALLSGSIFSIIFNAGLDFILLFLSTIPLFSVGLSGDTRAAIRAGLLATIPIFILTSSFYAVIMFFVIFALPCWYMCSASLNYYDIKINSGIHSLRLWYPIGLLTVYLAIYGCFFLAIITAVFATSDTNLPQHIILMIQNEMENLSKDYGLDKSSIYASPQNKSFLLTGITAWIWCILLLGHAWIVNNTLVKKNLAKRFSFAIYPFVIPSWLLTLIGICALASLIGGESMQFLGKTSLVILMFPYFVQGTAMIHVNTVKWPNRRFFLFFMYFITLVSLWTGLLIAGIGLWHHIKTLNKHLSSDGNSSKS